MNTIKLKRGPWEFTADLESLNDAEGAIEELRRQADLAQPPESEAERQEAAAKKADGQMAACCRAVFEAILTMPGRPWREIQAKAATLAKTRGGPIDLARNKLIGDGVIEAVYRFDANHRKLRGHTYVIKGPGVIPEA